MRSSYTASGAGSAEVKPAPGKIPATESNWRSVRLFMNQSLSDSSPAASRAGLIARVSAEHTTVCCRKHFARCFIEQNKVDRFERSALAEMFRGFSQHDFRAILHGKPGNSCADGGERNSLQSALGRQSQGMG